MTRGEKAVIYVIKEYLTQCPLMPSIEGISEVHFEVELLHFVQVKRIICLPFSWLFKGKNLRELHLGDGVIVNQY